MAAVVEWTPVSGLAAPLIADQPVAASHLPRPGEADRLGE